MNPNHVLLSRYMQVKKEFKTFEKNKRVIQKDGRQVCDTLLRPTEDRKRGADVNNLGAKLVGLGKNCGYAVDVHSIVRSTSLFQGKDARVATTLHCMFCKNVLRKKNRSRDGRHSGSDKWVLNTASDSLLSALVENSDQTQEGRGRTFQRDVSNGRTPQSSP